MKIKNNETVFVVAAILVLSSVLPTTTTTTAGLLSSTFYLSTQLAYATKQLSTEEDIVEPQRDPQFGLPEQQEEADTDDFIKEDPGLLRLPQQQEEGDTDVQEAEGDSNGIEQKAEGENVNKAPIAISEDNIYVAWWDNQNATDNNEVFLRASTDAGDTFGEKINVSNSNGSDSTDVDISADGTDVMVTWWERNQTAEEPVMRISNDNGATFGPILTLATNGTIGEAEGEEEG